MPTVILIAIILWLYSTGKKIQLPALDSEETTIQTSDNFLLDAEIQTEEIYLTGDTDTTGVRGYINISNSDLASMLPSEYHEFYETVLKNSSYQWFSIICPDGTGLFIHDCADGAASFCTLDELGRQTEVHGYLLVQGDGVFYQEAQ